MSKKSHQKNQWIIRLHGLGDMIGSRNDEYENNNIEGVNLDLINELIYQFIGLGGINGLDLKESNWKVTENTILFHGFIRGIIHYKGMINEKLILSIKNSLHTSYRALRKNALKGKEHYFKKGRSFTEIAKFTDTYDARFDQYRENSNNNECAVRALAIGMILSGEENREQLIELSLTTSMLTHNSPIGYLGGFTTALFCALALENVQIHKWPKILLDMLVSDKLKSHSNLNTSNLEIIDDYNQYVRMWKLYQNTRFNNNKLIRNKSFSNPMHRARYFNDNFYKDTVFGKEKKGLMGMSGYLCPIIAYDSLVECDGKFEKLLIFTGFIAGDTPSIAAVGCALYGAVYGQGDAPDYLFKDTEYRKDFDKLISAVNTEITRISEI